MSCGDHEKAAKTGGPAFPMAKVTVLAEDGTQNEASSITHNGMTLRDYFAAKAMQGLLANPKLIETINREGGAYSGWVEESAWSWADAMLKVRNQ